ncbi:hypothetical protein NKW84_14305 [Acetobacter senegalensis]|uniref:hypothetical protein n=1 Tax=Acetobacter senegalensis TaxID=446692 RepID=UPI00209E8720|nr:hypothetical protein [Acetobacter senegalensis]MCP1197024.1 hypothetical protein [Acetobacter senegalensis]
MPDLKDIWRLVQAMNELKAWRFIVIMLFLLALGLASAIGKALPGLAEVITACR